MLHEAEMGNARGYATALAAVAGATAVRLGLDPWLGNDAPLLVFVLAVLLAGRFGGVGPGIAATVLSGMVADFLFIRPRYDLIPELREDIVRVILFAVECLLVILVTEQQRRAHAQTLTTAQELARHRDELERLVRVRTSELHASNEALQAFAYSMSHDLRTPLRAMSGLAKAVLEDHGARLPPTGRDYLGRIASAALRIERLIERLLTYNRLSREDARIEAGPVDLNDVVAEVLLALRMDLEGTAATIEVEPQLPAVVGQDETLRQVMLNLLENALKFTRGTEAPRIRVWTESAAARTIVHVTDAGPGVLKSDRERIFRPFERVDTGHAGSGLGLSIVRRAIERMGGSLGVDDAEGGGADFWFSLPTAATGAGQLRAAAGR